MRVKPLPVIFACSCAASAGRLAGHVAAALDREGKAEATPVADVDAGVPQAVSKATARFPVVALDGCRIACARRCLERRGVTPNAHLVLAEFGIASREWEGFTEMEERNALAAVSAALA